MYYVLSLVFWTRDNTLYLTCNIYWYLYDKYLELLDVRKVLLTLVWNDQQYTVSISLSLPFFLA